MKSFVIFSLLAVLCASAPVEQPQHVSVMQSSDGNYKITFNIDGQSRAEQGNADGTVSGSYSYIDANGVLQTVQYTAGPDGFRPIGSHLPVAPVDTNVPVRDTEEVAKAKALHSALLQQGLPNLV